jgi:hypothetical protein
VSVRLLFYAWAGILERGDAGRVDSGHSSLRDADRVVARSRRVTIKLTYACIT